MSEYKENTVGWHLDRLKEPLRSRAIAVLIDDSRDSEAENMSEALDFMCLWEKTGMIGFWHGAYCFFCGYPRDDSYSHESREGWDMAKECAPDPVDEPAPEGENREKAPYGSFTNYMANRPEDVHDASPLRSFQKGMDTDTPLERIPEGYVDAEKGSFSIRYEGFRESPFRVDDCFSAVEGYTPPPRCVTDSEKLESALVAISNLEARMKELEGIVITLVRMECNRAPIGLPKWVEARISEEKPASDG